MTAKTPLIVSTEWLHEHLNDDHLRIVDIRGHVLPATEPPPHYFNHHNDYEKSHIPNAVFVDWVHEITLPSGKSNFVADAEQYAQVMSRLGIDENTFVVAYDDSNHMFASRLVWTLAYYGHPTAAILNGGWNKWIAENRPVTAEVPQIQPKEFKPVVHSELRRSAGQILDQLGQNQALIDVRTPAEFAGEASRASRKGHIPTAKNLPTKNFINADGTFLPPEQLREQLASIQIDGDSENVVFYCNGGVSASLAFIAYRLAGFDDASVYDGSWKDWGNDPEKPIE